MHSPLPKDFDPDCKPQRCGIYGLPTSPDEASLVLLPIAWEATTTFRKGTARGPAGIVEASYQVELYDQETGTPYERGIAILAEDPEIVQLQNQVVELAETNDSAAIDAITRRLHERVAHLTHAWREKGKLVGVIGGEHGVALGAMKAVAADVEEMGILQIDAHADLRTSYEGLHYSHASCMANVLKEIPQLAKLVQVGVRELCPQEAQTIAMDQRIFTVHDGCLDDERLDQILAQLPPRVWISLDVDGLDPSLCPNTGTPVPGGLRWRELMSLLRRVGQHRCIVGFDLCEVVPDQNGRDLGDGWDETVGARLLYKLCGWTLWDKSSWDGANR